MSSTTIRANTALDRPFTFKSTYLFKALFIWVLAAVFYFYDNLLQITPSAMKSELFAAFVQSDTEFGSLSAYCLYAYGLMQIPAGLLVDKHGPRRLLTTAALLCAGGSLLFAWSESLWLAKFARVWIGAGAAFALVCCLKIVNLWFSPRYFSLMTGFTVTIGMLGSVCALGTVGYLVEHFGWREAMNYSGVFGLILTTLIWIWVSDRPAKHPSAATPTPVPTAIWADLCEVMQNRHAWLMAAYAGFMFVPILAFGGLWGIPFMQEVHGLSSSDAGWSVSLIYLGFMLGGPVCGWLAETFKAKTACMLIANLSTLGVCAWLIYGEQLPLFTIQILLFCIGFLSSGFILAFGVIQENCPARLSGTAIGFTNALNTLGGALAQPLIGWALDQSDKQYSLALSILPLCLGLALLALWCSTRTQQTLAPA